MAADRHIRTQNERCILVGIKQRPGAGAGSVRPWTITAENIEDFRRALELQDDEARREEYLKIADRLYFWFDCKPWIDSILRIEDWRPPADHDLAEYERAYAIRRALEAASGIRKPQKRGRRPVVSPSGRGLSDSQKATKRTVEALKAKCLPGE